MGRPREFDADKALDQAMQVFWRKGYEGASVTDLTEAMGITRPSLYAAFGNKDELFRKVLDRYEAGPGRYVAEALDAPTARATVERIAARRRRSFDRTGQPRTAASSCKARSPAATRPTT